MNRKDGSETEDVVYCDACFVKTNVIGWRILEVTNGCRILTLSLCNPFVLWTVRVWWNGRNERSSEVLVLWVKSRDDGKLVTKDVEDFRILTMDEEKGSEVNRGYRYGVTLPS